MTVVAKIPYKARLELERRSPSNQPPLPPGEEIKRWGDVLELARDIT